MRQALQHPRSGSRLLDGVHVPPIAKAPGRPRQRTEEPQTARGRPFIPKGDGGLTKKFFIFVIQPAFYSPPLGGSKIFFDSPQTVDFPHFLRFDTKTAALLCYFCRDGKPPTWTTTAGGGKDMDEMPNAGEIIERLARENERQKIEIDQLRRKIAELEAALTNKA